MGVAVPLVGEEQGRRPARPEASRIAQLSRVEDAAPAAAPGSRACVLVVEDDPSMQMLVAYNLEAAGFRVVVAATGQEGVELGDRERPDLVLLDVMLPDLGGFDVAQRLRGLPIVFMSARGSETDIEHARRLGAIDYVVKPFDPVALPVRLREDLEQLDLGGSGSVWALRFGTSQE